MSLKAELEIFSQALLAYDTSHLPTALQLFQSIAESSKIHLNIALVHSALSDHPEAIRSFSRAVRLDTFCAVGWFGRGVAWFVMASWERARLDFERTRGLMRANDEIDYTQLGLPFSLHLAEIEYNLSLTLFHLGRDEEALALLSSIRDSPSPSTPGSGSGSGTTRTREWIGKAIESNGKGCTVFSIPIGILFRPSESKLKNLGKKDYKGTATLIAASSTEDEFTTFTGSRKKEQSRSQSQSHPRTPATPFSSTSPSISTPTPTSTPGSTWDSPLTTTTTSTGTRSTTPQTPFHSHPPDRPLPASQRYPQPQPPQQQPSGFKNVLRRSNTLVGFIRSPSFLGRGVDRATSAGAGEGKNEMQGKPIPHASSLWTAHPSNPNPHANATLFPEEALNVRPGAGRSVSDSTRPGVGPLSAPVWGYRGQLQDGVGSSPSERGGQGGWEGKSVSPLRPRRPDRPVQPVRPDPESSGVPLLKPILRTKQGESQLQLEGVFDRFGLHAGETDVDRDRGGEGDDRSVYSTVTGKTGRLGSEEVVDLTASGGTWGKEREELRMTELFEGYYGLGDEERAGRENVPPVPPVPSLPSFPLAMKPLSFSQQTRPGQIMHPVHNSKVSSWTQPLKQVVGKGTRDPNGNPILPRKPSTSSPLAISPMLVGVNSPGGNDSAVERGEPGVWMEMKSVRVKIRYEQDVRAVVITPTTDLASFRTLLQMKFNIRHVDFRLDFKDEEGDRVHLKDEGDWEAAVGCARGMAAGRQEGRLEVWLQ